MVNLYKMGQKIIKSKEDFFAKYNGLKESQFDKNGFEQWEEQILEMENTYKETCFMYGDEPSKKVLEWDKYNVFNSGNL